MKELIVKRLALKARDKKGFTLIEVIVVLVILAILAAIAIPSLTGYIDKANQRAATAQAAAVRTALQSIATDSYGTGGFKVDDSGYEGDSLLKEAAPGYSWVSGGNNPTFADEVTALTGINVVKATGETDEPLQNIKYDANRALTGFTVTINGQKVEYLEGEYSVIP
ncbi:MAG: prepilin-type N-terminal cleavage/methylation domain-containing protein [Coriobacteriales bacterium]|nr:prepilin-type N-terminal cleavage/methylation domain-containing protein [Coriobacteriales bacterium]